MTQLVGLVSV